MAQPFDYKAIIEAQHARMAARREADLRLMIIAKQKLDAMIMDMQRGMDADWHDEVALLNAIGDLYSLDACHTMAGEISDDNRCPTAEEIEANRRDDERKWA